MHHTHRVTYFFWPPLFALCVTRTTMIWSCFTKFWKKCTAELDLCPIRTLKLPGFEMYVNSLSWTINFVLNRYTSISLIFNVQIISPSLSQKLQLNILKIHPSLASICRPTIAKCLNINKCTQSAETCAWSAGTAGAHSYKQSQGKGRRERGKAGWGGGKEAVL